MRVLPSASGSHFLPLPIAAIGPLKHGICHLPLRLALEQDGSIINPKLKSLNRAIHQLGKSADFILRLVKSNEMVSENDLQKRLTEHTKFGCPQNEIILTPCI